MEGGVEKVITDDWEQRSVRMFRWAGRCWWGFLGAMLPWSLPPGVKVLTFLYCMGFTFMVFVLLGLFSFAMAIWKEGGK